MIVFFVVEGMSVFRDEWLVGGENLLLPYLWYEMQVPHTPQSHWLDEFLVCSPMFNCKPILRVSLSFSSHNEGKQLTGKGVPLIHCSIKCWETCKSRTMNNEMIIHWNICKFSSTWSIHLPRYVWLWISSNFFFFLFSSSWFL